MRARLIGIFVAVIFFMPASKIWCGGHGSGEALNMASGKLRIGLFNPHFSPAEKRVEQKTYVKEALKTLFDFRELGKNILREYYPSDPIAERKFLDALAEYIATVFLINTKGYDDLSLMLNSASVRKDNSISAGITLIKNGIVEKYEMKFWMYPVGGRWKIYWLEAEDFNIISNLSSQFRRTVQRGSIETLIAILQNKNPTN